MTLWIMTILNHSSSLIYNINDTSQTMVASEILSFSTSHFNKNFEVIFCQSSVIEKYILWMILEEQLIYRACMDLKLSQNPPDTFLHCKSYENEQRSSSQCLAWQNPRWRSGFDLCYTLYKMFKVSNTPSTAYTPPGVRNPGLWL